MLMALSLLKITHINISFKHVTTCKKLQSLQQSFLRNSISSHAHDTRNKIKMLAPFPLTGAIKKSYMYKLLDI